MRKKQTNPRKMKRRVQTLEVQKKRSCRNYSPESMQRALSLVQKGNSVYKASRRCRVPEQSLRDRVLGHVKADAVRSGPGSMFTVDEERDMVDHIQLMGQIGYGYTRKELLILVSDMAVLLKRKYFTRKDPSAMLSYSWLDHFLDRWPCLKLGKPRSLSMARAMATNPECIHNYFVELKKVMDKYRLHDKPQYIYNVDESGFSTEHNPPKALGSRGFPMQAITSPRTNTVTLTACVNAAGQALPPYIIFKGKRETDDLRKGASPGTAIRMSDSGWSNSKLFLDFLEMHFMKFVPQHDSPILMLYDGHKSHLCTPVIQWARANNIILFVLPPHTSHVTQPLDVACFGPVKRVYNAECKTYMTKNPGMTITRYNMCSLICSSFSKAMTISNITSAFRKTGIFPFNQESITPEQLAPSRIASLTNTTKNKDPQSSKASPSLASILSGRLSNTVSEENMRPRKRPRCKSVSGVITEGVQPNMTSNDTSRSSVTKENSPPLVQVPPAEPQPGPSHIHVTDSPPPNSQNSIQEKEVCCQCKRWSPPALRNMTGITTVDWAQCDYRRTPRARMCNHWVHLRFCVPVLSVEADAKYFCPCCSN